MSPIIKTLHDLITSTGVKVQLYDKPNSSALVITKVGLGHSIYIGDRGWDIIFSAKDLTVTFSKDDDNLLHELKMCLKMVIEKRTAAIKKKHENFMATADKVMGVL
jgi:hypothetical protein